MARMPDVPVPVPPAQPAAPPQSPIFLKSFEALVWLLEHTKKFPKSQRFVLAKRMEEAALSFQDELLWATKTRDKRDALERADFHLERLRMYNRIAHRMKLESLGQYEHLSKLLEELGRLLGGWLKKVPASR